MTKKRLSNLEKEVNEQLSKALLLMEEVPNLDEVQNEEIWDDDKNDYVPNPKYQSTPSELVKKKVLLKAMLEDEYMMEEIWERFLSSYCY